jgi:DNA-binding PucR family transcriptional regulator
VATSALSNAVPRIAPSLDLQEVLTDIVTEAAELLHATTGDIIMIDREHGVFRIVAAARHGTGVVGEEFPLDEGLSARVVTAARTLIVPDYSRYEHRIRKLRDYGFRAAIASPLVARDETIGVLTVEQIGTEDRFSEDDARLLTAFANHAAVAIDNARRYENEVALARDLTRANEELSRSLGLQRRLVEQVLADRGPGAVAGELARLLDRRVVLQDRFLRDIAGGAPDGSEDWRALALPHGENSDARLRRRLDRLTDDWRPTVLGDQDIDGPPRLVAPIVASHQEVAGFLVIDWAGEPTALDLALVEVAATGVALELMKISGRAEVEHAVRGDLATDLVNGAYSSEDLIVARAARMGYDLGEPRDLILLGLDPAPHVRLPDHDLVRLKRRIFDAVSGEVSAAAPASIVAALDDRVLILAAQCDRAAGGYSEREPRTVAEALCRRLRGIFPDRSFSAAIGRRCSMPRDYGASFELARSALDAMVKLGKRGVVVDGRGLGMDRLLVEATSHEALRAHVAATLAPLISGGQRGQELLQTLDAYVASGFNQRATARRAYVHINTVANRLERIGERLGRDMSDPETLVELALSLRLARLLDIV